MNINYDQNKIETALDDFMKATGINATFVKNDLTFFPSQKNEILKNKYCVAVQSSPKGIQGCLCSDQELLKKCQMSKKPEIHLCHAGLIDVAVPIIYNNEILGYLLLGQMKENKPFSHIEGYIKNLLPDTNSISKYYKELTVFDPSRIKSIVSIAEMLSKFLLLENSLYPKYTDNIQSAKDYINNNLKSKLTIESISHNCGLSKNTLYREFKNEFNITVGEYITQRRIKKSEELLVSTDKSIEEISEQAGFSSAAYFTSVFKKFNNNTPLKFRKSKQLQ
jgi:AraC-like DNA-binding protein